MTVTLIIMLVFLGIALVILVAAFVLVGLRGYALYKTVRGIQAEMEREIKALTEKQQEALSRIERIQGGQQQLTQNTQGLVAAVTRVSYLLGQLAEARNRLNIAR